MGPDIELGVVESKKAEDHAKSAEVTEEDTTVESDLGQKTRDIPERSIHVMTPRELFEILQEDTKTQFLHPQNAASDIFDGAYMSPGERWEGSIGFLHFKNVQYLRSKVLKHDVISRALSVPDEAPNAERMKRAEALQEMNTFERLDTIRDDLAHYATALQNYRDWSDTWTRMRLTEHNGLPERLAALECGKYHNLWSEKALADALKDVVLHYEHPGLPADGHLAIVKKFVDQSKKRKFVSRLTMALFGGAALIAPMLIMTLHQTKLTTLLTTSLFVFAVAAVLAWWMEDAESKDIVGATAAYAAVLVVFVGTGGGSSG
ncbi:hypothetical protein B0J14DRAFT_596547 [Halenospora varia]|nr:hypothetical protein B0J14DRAFT_596547 [Halenospora varia]